MHLLLTARKLPMILAGGDDGWASGVRMLIKHQILAQQE
jgi:hypothetical protein